MSSDCALMVQAEEAKRTTFCVAQAASGEIEIFVIVLVIAKIQPHGHGDVCPSCPAGQ